MARVIRRRQQVAESILGFLLRPWLGRAPMTADQIRASKPERILLVRAHDMISDMIVGTPAFSAVGEVTSTGSSISRVRGARQRWSLQG